jgi:HlyD family secretion protein
VFVAVDGRVQERAVRLGLRTLGAVEVVEGLAEGDEVLLGGTLKAGDRVRPEAASPAKPAAQKSGGADAGSALTNTMGR